MAGAAADNAQVPDVALSAATWPERIASTDCLESAFSLMRPKDSTGVDRKSYHDFYDQLTAETQRLADQLRTGTYRHLRVRQVDIPKPNGGTRRLGIPAVRDKVVQIAIMTSLTHELEPQFMPSSHGFRPSRGVQTATEQVRDMANNGFAHPLEIDLQDFFNRPDHGLVREQLTELLRRADRPADRWLLDLISNVLTCGAITPEGREARTVRGLPQGGPLSPLLANVVLHRLDEVLAARGLQQVRYADDIAIMAKTARSAKRNLKATAGFITDQLGLEVNTSKSGLRELDEFIHLGIGYCPTDEGWQRTLPPKVYHRLFDTTFDPEGSMTADERLQRAGNRTRGRFRYYDSLLYWPLDPAYAQWEEDTKEELYGYAQEHSLNMPNLNIGLKRKAASCATERSTTTPRASCQGS